jgi:ATP-dependent Lon protease
MDNYSEKYLKHFKGKVVRKDLTNIIKRNVNVPTFVLEYLMGIYCATDDEQAVSLGVQKITKIINDNYVRPEDSERIKSLIRAKGEYTIIDKLVAYLNEYDDRYYGEFINLDISGFVVPDEYIMRHSKILSGGIWVMAKVSYSYLEGCDIPDNKKRVRGRWTSPYSIISLKPIQLPNIDFETVTERRSLFTNEEWVNLVLRGAGIEGNNLTKREKLHYLLRMVPLCQRNFNLVELGPRGTGKSHIYKELSPNSILISGGQTTVANLFYNMNTRTIGLVGHWDCVAFDEVAGIKFTETDSIQIMKDYMASGSFSRGKESINAEASMVFVGNINQSLEKILKTSHLFSPFPKEYNNDSAFFDRIHAYLPGWEIAKIKRDVLTKEYGFISDYLAEILTVLRTCDFSDIFDKFFKFNSHVNQRDEIGIRKTFEGLLKLIYPDKNVSMEEAKELLEYAIESRRRVKEQLKRIAGDEFADVKLGYIDSKGEEKVIQLPETIDVRLDENSLPCGFVYTLGRGIDSQRVSLYKLENRLTIGSGKVDVQGILSAQSIVKESVNAAWLYFIDYCSKIFNIKGVTKFNYLTFINDICNNGVTDEVGAPLIVAYASLLSNKPILAGSIIVGNINISGTMAEIENVTTYIKEAVNVGAKYLFLPADCQTAIEKANVKVTNNLKIVLYKSPVELCQLALGGE